jgi:hypothetical protein
LESLKLSYVNKKQFIEATGICIRGSLFSMLDAASAEQGVSAELPQFSLQSDDEKV